jgi:DNA topoisomerase VI subunit A
MKMKINGLVDIDPSGYIIYIVTVSFSKTL